MEFLHGATGCARAPSSTYRNTAASPCGHNSVDVVSQVLSGAETLGESATAPATSSHCLLESVVRSRRIAHPLKRSGYPGCTEHARVLLVGVVGRTGPEWIVE